MDCSAHGQFPRHFTCRGVAWLATYRIFNHLQTQGRAAAALTEIRMRSIVCAEPLPAELSPDATMAEATFISGSPNVAVSNFLKIELRARHVEGIRMAVSKSPGCKMCRR